MLAKSSSLMKLVNRANFEDDAGDTTRYAADVGGLATDLADMIAPPGMSLVRPDLLEPKSMSLENLSSHLNEADQQCTELLQVLSSDPPESGKAHKVLSHLSAAVPALKELCVQLRRLDKAIPEVDKHLLDIYANSLGFSDGKAAREGRLEGLLQQRVSAAQEKSHIWD
ncbi:MAG TPA: hypothetical protein VMZ31_01255 [Phycisphaerae bacterium]|nr:hypothetical protein [Phycisphaerae bacterium]